jgi:hypothetical protein
MDGKSMGEGIKFMMRVLFVLGLISGVAMVAAVACLAGWF